MKKLLTILVFAFIGLSTFAQGDYDDLLEMLVDEQYEKLLYKAEKYTLTDKTKKDALPYLYMSMAYYEISKDEELSVEIPKSFKQSLKYAGKFRSKDKEDAYFAEYQEYLDQLRQRAVQEADPAMDQEKYTGAKLYYKYLVKFDETDPGAWTLQGYCELRLKRKKEAAESLAMAKQIISESGVGHLSDIQMDIFKTALIMLAEGLDEMGDRTQAREWMELGLDYFKEDNEYLVTYDTIVG
ncbi:MAG: tetratricopeptide (TPR) repeat protein [Flavobacteriales bacterium]|jgi:tetratricopeptide (TPR) repeat protein